MSKEQLYDVMKHMGYEESFCYTIAYKYLNTDFTSKRMIGYLKQEQHPKEEDVVDEMLAILSDRDAWIQKKMMEEYQSKNNNIKYMFDDEE